MNEIRYREATVGGCLEARVEHRADCDRRLNVELHLGRDVGEHSQVVGDFDSDHGPDLQGHF